MKYMKCKSCGTFYEDSFTACPHCSGGVTKPKGKHASPLANFLDRDLHLGTLTLTWLNIFLVFAINLSIISVVTNCILYFNDISPAVWFQYVLCGLLAVYILFKASFGRHRFYTVLRRVLCVLLLAILISDFICATTVTAYAVPATACLMAVLGLVLLLTQKITNTSFLYTNLVCFIYGGISLLMMLFDRFDFTTFAKVSAFVGIGVSALVLANYLLAMLISLPTRIRKSF